MRCLFLRFFVGLVLATGVAELLKLNFAFYYFLILSCVVV